VNTLKFYYTGITLFSANYPPELKLYKIIVCTNIF
jgi:hypothetical protein